MILVALTVATDPVFVIFIRFSFIGHSDWMRWRKTGHGSTDPEAVAAALYTEDRMARRFWSFEQLTLPSLMHQTDKDFLTVFLTSPEMPQHHLQRLQALIAPLDGASVLISDAPSVEAALIEPLEAFNATTNHLVQLRLDDDDALSVNFIARLRENARKMASYKSYAISQCLGLTLHNWDGTPRALRMTHLPFVGIGTAARMPRGLSIFHFSHVSLSRRLPSLQDPREVNFFHQRWTGSDTDKGPGIDRKPEREVGEQELRRALKNEFPFLTPLNLLKQDRMGGTDRPRDSGGRTAPPVT